MKRLLFLMAFAVAGSASAQQIMDGSGKNISEEVKSKLFTALTSVVADPFSAQIVGLKKAKNRPELICGIVNLKNSYGAYTGFRGFGYNLQYDNILIQDLSDCT